MVEWKHFSNDKALKLTNKYMVNRKMFVNKPNGFWLSYNDAWLEWCENAEFFTFGPEHYFVHYFNIDYERDKILTISTFDELINFTEKYSCISKDLTDSLDGINYVKWHIDWEKVAEQFNGIAFLNYNEIKSLIRRGLTRDILIERKMIDINTKFYEAIFTWYLIIDCSSACIFNVDILNCKRTEECFSGDGTKKSNTTMMLANDLKYET